MPSLCVQSTMFTAFLPIHLTLFLPFDSISNTLNNLLLVLVHSNTVAFRDPDFEVGSQILTGDQGWPLVLWSDGRDLNFECKHP